MRNEPLVEITQIKGTSETHPILSDNDEWAGFEIMPYRVATVIHSEEKGSYAREALLSGLSFEDKGIRNPYKFGFIGSSDTHTVATPDSESDYVGKVGLLDADGSQRGSLPLPASQVEPGAPNQETIGGNTYVTGANQTWSAAGLAGVWAEENTRDLNSAALQRLQIIKGWTIDGVPHERVYDIACSDGLSPDPGSHRCPDNGARVNISDCSVTRRVGDPELKAVWSDPEFDPSVRAFYYVRVLENPTCRWSTWDAVRAGISPRPNLVATIQERAWSSPIWYVPN